MTRPLLPLMEGKLDHHPLVGLVVGSGARRFALLRDPELSEEEFEGMLAEGVANLDRIDLPMEARQPAGQLFYRSLSPLSSEGILSPRFLGRLAEALRSTALAVAIPTRGMLLATRLAPDNGAMLQGLANMARDLFNSGGAQALTPHLFLVDGGALKGPIRIEVEVSPEAKKSPPSQPQIKVLPARTVAEAHLYMDLRGAEPGRRNQRLVQMGDDLVSVYDARCFDEPNPTTFAFLVEDVSSPPGVYGTGSKPSRIIAPDEFLLRADLLSKRVPASPTGLDAEGRRRAKYMLESAANCVMEAAKFIPPGADQVPESAMALRSQWERLQLTPGRFHRMRLEAVARTYRDIAAKFLAALRSGP